MDPISNPTSTPTPSMPTSEKKSLSAVASIIIIVALLVIGGVYFWFNTSDKLEVTPSQPTTKSLDTVTKKLTSQNKSDEIDAIKTDLAKTNIDEIDKDLQTDSNL